MDYLVVVNPCIMKKLSLYGVKDPKIIYIPNFVSEREFYVQSEEEISKTRERYGLPKNKFIAVGAGQLQTRKGIVDFVETAKKCPEIQFVWAGGFSFGKITDGYAEIKQICENPPENVKFLGILAREEMVSIYNMADILFLPSFDELFPMTILEALCCKKPLLLRDIEVYPDILFDCYAKGNNSDEFAEILKNLSGNRESLNYWQDKAWECHLYYSEEQILKMWKKLYSEAYVKLKNKEPVFSEGNI